MLSKPIETAENWLLDLGASGVTRPQIFSCSDGTDRVLKISGLGGATAAMLTAEWVGSLLAVDLEVVTPRPGVIEISLEALASAPADVRDTARPGIAFGSEYVRHAIQPLGLSTLTEAPNHVELLSRLWVVDAWLGVEDRMFPDFGRNLLINNEGRAKELMAIDFGLSMTPALFPMLGAAPTFDVEKPRSWPGAMHLLDLTTVYAALDDLEALTEAEVTKIVRTTPDAWADDARRGAVIRYLLTRQRQVRTVIAPTIEGTD